MSRILFNVTAQVARRQNSEDRIKNLKRFLSYSGFWLLDPDFWKGLRSLEIKAIRKEP